MFKLFDAFRVCVCVGEGGYLRLPSLLICERHELL